MPKKIHLELIRVFAIMLVVFNHTPAFHMPLQSAEVTWSWVLMLAASLADKMGVPLFFMVSGALLLGREESLMHVLRHRVLRMLLVLALFLVAQNAYFVGIGQLTLAEGVHQMVRLKSPAPATWFLSAYTAFLLILPLLRLLAQHMQPRHFVYLIILHLVFYEFIPLEHTPLSPWLPSTAIVGWLYIFPLLGYAAEHGKCGAWAGKLNRLGLYAAAALGAGVLLNAAFPLLLHRLPSVRLVCFSGTVLFPALFCYAAAKRYAPSLPQGLQRVLLLLGPATFTIMLTENMFRGIISAHMTDYSSSYATSCVVTLLTCGGGWLLGMLFKRIPLIRRLV